MRTGRLNLIKIVSNSLFILSVYLLPISLYSQYEQEYKTIKDANQAYTQGNFSLAAELYESVLSKGLSAPELNYNLGNAYYRLGDYKRAILHYERARLLIPDDENIKVNLELCQRYIQDKIDIVPRFFVIKWIENFIDMFSVSVWAFISIFCFVLFLTATVIFLFTKTLSFRKIALYGGFLLFVCSFISFYAAYTQNEKLINKNNAIVFSPAVTVKSSPNDNGTDLFIIHEGLKVTVTGKSGNWKEIRLSDGKIGWLPASSIEEI